MFGNSARVMLESKLVLYSDCIEAGFQTSCILKRWALGCSNNSVTIHDFQMSLAAFAERQAPILPTLAVAGSVLFA